jgi:hypothetical protein
MDGSHDGQHHLVPTFAYAVQLMEAPGAPHRSLRVNALLPTGAVGVEDRDRGEGPRDRDEGPRK